MHRHVDPGENSPRARKDTTCEEQIRTKLNISTGRLIRAHYPMLFTRAQHGEFAWVGNFSLLLLSCRQWILCLWLWSLWTGGELRQSELATAIICLVSAFLPTGRFEYPSMTHDELRRMCIHLKCLILSKQLGLAHAGTALLCFFCPESRFTVINAMIISPALLAVPVAEYYALLLRYQPQFEWAKAQFGRSYSLAATTESSAAA